MAQLPAHDYLDRLKIPYQRMTFPAATEKGAASVARALGFRERQMVKTLIFETDSQVRALIMVGGDQNVISGHLKKALGSRNIAMASRENVLSLTGYEVGSIPPFHWQPEDFQSFLDSSLISEEYLGVGAGVWGHEIVLKPDDLVKASRCRVINLTDKGKEVF
ncbi:MAG: deacylase [Candidatus Melainabacteria bacterium]|nr:MAG: deacylase [Candidatus Melainabacteria bacterium]